MISQLTYVVPVYNVADYLTECVESLIEGDMAAAEIILIDDGSSDGSETICDRLAERFACVRCIHKRNAGVAAARNDGLAAARGRYIAFVDADDRVAAGGTQRILVWAERADADVCFLQAKKFYPDGASADLGDGITRSGIASRDKEAVFRYLASRPKFPGSACTKVFKREFLQQNGLSFPAGRRHGEDLTFVLNCLLLAQSFDALDTPYYEYRQGRAGAATAAVTAEACRNTCLFVSGFADRLTREKRAIDPICESAMAFVAYEYSIILWQYARMQRMQKQSVLSFLREYRWVAGFAGTKKLRLIGFAVRAAGVVPTSFLLDMYMRVSRGR